MKLSVVIIAKDEEANIGRCLESVKWADEIIVVDSGSKDRTKDIATSYNAKLFDIEWRGFGYSKQYALSQTTNDWILSIDADEEISPELSKEIKSVINNDHSYDGYLIPRKTMFLGRWIYHCGWYPDHVLRLFRRDKGKFDSAIVHESVILDGRVGLLKNELLHYSYPDLRHYFRKFSRYTECGAEQAFSRGKRANFFDLSLRPPVAFIKHYIIKQGFRDGWRGLLISALSAMAVMVKYARLKELWEKEAERNASH